MREIVDHPDYADGPELDRDIGDRAPANVFTILIVDSQPAHCELMAKMLRALGYRTVSASDGIEALDRIHRQPAPDLVIMAVDLPRMNGIETISAIRSLSSPMSRLPIAAVTADAPPHLNRELPSAGADTLLPRPFDMHELAKAASSLLSGRLERVSAESLRRSFGVSS